MEIYFKATPKTDIGEDEAMGRVLIDEFNQDDDDLPFEIVCERPSEYVAQVKQVLKTKVKAEIQRVVNELKSELK
jgi:polysaccharide pyruvyl transferase WcaK-like protein